MPNKTPWTVMVYLAANNELTNFAIDSLKQMKAVCGDRANVLAELFSGTRRPTKRYLFDHKTALGSIEQNKIYESPARDPGDPANLTAFIQWAATHYEAEHYFVIIWGHGAGCDDDFPRPPNAPPGSDRSFVQRHRLLNPGKGVPNEASKGVLDEASKGVPNEASKGVLDEASKGVLDEASKSVLPRLTGQISIALKDVPFHLEQSGENETSLNGEILFALEKGMLAAFREGVFKDMHERILAALKAGIRNAGQTGVFNDMQRHLVRAYRVGGYDAVESHVKEAVQTGAMNRLFRKVVHAMQSSAGVPAQANPAPQGGKALAFSDHPASYLTNLGLREALRNACQSLPDGKRKIDIVGMDACNMNMVEIGYEIRDYADYLVASQDSIPDASWPYDRILRQLLDSPRVLPRDLACVTATTYVTNYRDYVNEPVALSVLDLGESTEMLGIFKEFTVNLEKFKGDSGVRQAIISARRHARSFGQNQFVDIVDFCQYLAEDPGSKGLGGIALSLISHLQPFVAYNECCEGERGCNGTSIYFPEFDPTNFEHQQDLAILYGKLDFAEQTGWGGFVAEFLKHQTKEWRAAKAAQENMQEAAAIKATKLKKAWGEPPSHDQPMAQGTGNGAGGSSALSA